MNFRMTIGKSVGKKLNQNGKYDVIIIIKDMSCSACGSEYVDNMVGQSHVYGRCPKCERRDEIGLVA